MICVDASCSKNPGPVNYRGKDMEQDGKIIFEVAVPHGTNNIGEFLAVVHALAYCKQNGITRDIYSDSVTAIAWVRNKKCNTTLQPCEDTEIYEKVMQKIRDAETFLTNYRAPNKILKWRTDLWDEIPADYGKKGGKKKS